MAESGWEWPVLLLILAGFPDTWEGERAAVQTFADLHVAWRTGRLTDLDEIRRRYLQGDA